MKQIISRLFASILCALLLSGCGAAVSASASRGLSQSQNATSSSPAPTHSATQKLYSGGTSYYLSGTGIALSLRKHPEENSPVLQESVFQFNALETVDEWVYGSWGNLLGWVPAGALAQIDSATTAPFFLPAFFTQEQQLQFLRATEMFNAYLCSNNGLRLNYDLPPVSSSEEGWSAYWDAAFSDYASFDAALHSLFTQDYLASMANPSFGHFYKNIDEKLYLIEGDRGSFAALVESFTLQEQTDTRIAFLANFVFVTPLSEYRCSLPMEMTNTAEGWRFSQFTSGSDDIRWMDAMGSDFDPWEGQE